VIVQRSRVLADEPVSAFRGTKTDTQIHRNRDHQWEAAMTKHLAERKVALRLTLLESQDDLAITLRDSDGIKTVTRAKLAL